MKIAMTNALSKLAFPLFFCVLIFLGASCSTDEEILEAPTDDTQIDESEEVETEDASDTDASDTTDDDTPDEDTSETPDSDSDNDTMDEDENSSGTCTDPQGFIYVENQGLVTVEFESAHFEGDWELKTNEADFSGDGFMVWTGSQSLQNPGQGLTTFKIKIEQAGTYQFVWKSAVTIGNNGTEHNDSWLRFADADDFFGKKDGSIVYPRGTGKTPNPNGSSKEGWFKIYRSGNDLGFKWQSKTSDHNGHDIFVTFDQPGTYTMEVSARSSGHGIDKFVLFTDAYSLSAATDGGNALSEIDCD